MNSIFTDTKQLLSRCYNLALPYGRKKLLIVTFFIFIQGVLQVVGVTSIFPFLALASDPDSFRKSISGAKLLNYLPQINDSNLLLCAGVFAIAMLLIANLTNILGEYVRSRYANLFAHWLRLRLIHRVASRPYADFLQANTGVLIKKVLGDVYTVSNTILLNLLDICTRLIMIILLVITLFIIHPAIALYSTLGLIFIYLVFYFSLRKWRDKASNILKVAGRGSFKEIQQLFGGIKAVKIHRAESLFIQKYSNHSLAQAKISAILPVIGNSPRYFIEPIAFGSLVISVLVLSSNRQSFNSILPNLGVMALAGYRLLPAIQLLYSQLCSLNSARFALDEVYDEFLAVENTIEREESNSLNHFTNPDKIVWNDKIIFDHVSFKYASADRHVIENLSFTIPKNTSIGIIGQTGSGKSTLVDLILGLHLPKSGKIIIDQKELLPSNRRAWRAGIGYVPQDIFLLDDTITANIAFGLPEEKVSIDKLRRAATAAQIIRFIEEELPLKFDTIVGERGVRLSGGQRQRIGLARALYNQPDLLILDEATSALDISTEKEVMKAINALHGSITLIIIAHRLSTLESCDTILDLDSIKK